MSKIMQIKNLSYRSRCVLLMLSLIIVILDQVSKFEIRDKFKLYEVKELIQNYWNWTLVYNKGAAFSFLANTSSDLPKIIFGILAVIVAIFLVHYIVSRTYSMFNGIAIAFILGGALGNLVDRIIFGYVTDFIQWHYYQHYWPTFNIADSAICVGACLLIIEGLFFNAKHNDDTKK